VNCVQTTNEVLREQLKRMFNYEFSDNSQISDALYSVEDKQFLKRAEAPITKINGHYQLELPWKEDDVTLPYNRLMAEKRLAYLKRKFEGDSDLFTSYKDKINDLLINEYARKVPPGCKPHPGRTWYIPHHSCCSAGKFRVVHDCAASFGDTSMNDCLLSGPDLTNNLTGVLLRFRQEKIAFTADIKSMFLQVQVDPKDWDGLRFLWWPNDDQSREPSDYQMLVHLFGAKSSPACTNFALRKVADDNETYASTITVLTVKRNFYVDDCLKSVKGVKEAIQLIKELSMLLKTGGFHLTKYLSNCREVLSAIDHEDLDPRVKTLYLDNFFDDLPV